MTAPQAAPIDTATAEPDCPYVGLRPFEAAHARFFFGRERDQRLIIANLLAQPLTVLYGASGVGKSSVLNAGVVPQLHRQRPGTPVVVFSGWARAGFRRELAERCIDATWATGPAQPRPSPDLPFDEVLRACAEAVHDTVLVVFDQFEEYFYYHPKTAAPTSFEAEFARAVNRDDVDVGFLLALREDGLAKLDHFQERIPNLLGNRLRLRHLDEAGARMAITGPLEVWNADAGRAGDHMGVDDELVDLLIQQVRVGRVSVASQAGSGAADGTQDGDVRIEAPFLQLVLLRLWEKEREQGSTRLGAATLDELGGAEAIVGQHLDLAMRRLSDTERAVCANVFDRLVTPTGTKIACSRDALVGWAGPRLAGHVAGVLAALCKARILRPTELVEERDQEAYEVFHDVLAPAILDWRSRYITAREREEAVERERAQAEQERAAIKRRAQTRLLWASGVLTLIALAGWGFSFVQGRRARANAEAAQALLAVSRDEPMAALDLALEAADETGTLLLPPTRAAADALRQSLRILPNRAQTLAVEDLVSTVAFSDDGRLVASGGEDGRVTLWDLRDGELRRRETPALEHDAWVRKAAFLPPRPGATGDRLLTVADGTVRLFDLSRPDGAPRRFDHGSPIYGAFAVSADHRLMATAGRPGEGRPSAIKVWDLEAEGETPITQIDLHGAWVMGLAFSPDGCCLATAMVTAGGGRSYTDIWAVEGGKRIAPLPNPVASDAVIFTPDGEELITAGRDGLGRVFRPSSGGGLPALLAGAASHAADGAPAVAWETSVLSGHTDRIRALAVTADGSRIATAAGDGTVRIWDALSGQTLFTFRDHTRYVESVAFSPDGRFVVSGGRDDTVCLRDVGRHAGSVNAIAFAPGGNMVATAGADHTARLWSVTGDVPELLHTLHGHGREVYRLAFDPTGKILATAGYDRTVRLWDVATGEPLGEPLRDHGDELRDVAFDAAGRHLVSAGADGMIYIHDATALDAKPVALRHGPEHPLVQVQAVAISPVGDLLATAGNDGVIRLWSLGGEDRGRLEPKGFTRFTDLAFRPDGGEVAALGLRYVVIWPADALRQTDGRPPGLVIKLREEGLPKDGVCTSVAWSADGSRLGVGCNDGATYVFAMPGGRRTETITAHDGAVTGVAFGPDGTRLATSSSDATFLVAPLRFDDLYLRARRLRQRASAPTDDR
jgi:WD40 repeat protein